MSSAIVLRILDVKLGTHPRIVGVALHWDPAGRVCSNVSVRTSSRGRPHAWATGAITAGAGVDEVHGVRAGSRSACVYALDAGDE